VPQLHLPGVRLVPNVIDLEQAKRLSIGAMRTYTAPNDAPEGPTSGRAVLQIGDQYYDIGLDGSRLHPLPFDARSCDTSLVLTRDGAWAGCASSDGPRMFSLRAQPLGDRGPMISDARIPQTRAPAWGPDGQQVAVGVQGATGCEIALLATPAAHDAFRLTGILALPDFSVPGGTATSCTMVNLAWSPDGAWLAFADLHARSLTYYALHLAEALPLSRRHTASPLTVTIPRATLVRLGDALGGLPTWTRDSAAVAMIGLDGKSIVQIDLATQTPRVLLKQDVAEICAVSWVPDMGELAFILCQPVGGDFVAPPAHLYVYSPSERQATVDRHRMVPNHQSMWNTQPSPSTSA
jgi:hypothetical protein